MSVYGGATPQKTKQNKNWVADSFTGQKQNILQTSQKLLLLLAFVFVTTASIASRISSGDGERGRGRKKTKSKSNTYKLHPRSLGAVGGEEVAFGLQRGEYFLQHPLRPVPEVLLLRPRVINHWDLFSCQYQQKDPGTQQRHLQ